MKTTKKHIRENTKRYSTRKPFNYWYQHDNNTAFELRRVALSSIRMVIKHCDNSHIVIARNVITSKEQFVDIVYDYLKFKNT
jgi:hypothetical protein